MQRFSTLIVVVLGSLAANVLLPACMSEGPGYPDQAERQAVQSAEDGLVQFFIGAEATAAAEEGRTYIPSVEDWYTRITVPEEMVTRAEENDAPTVSFCDSSNGVFVYDHVYVGPEQAMAMRPIPPDPVLSTTDAGELIQAFQAGQDGIYGYAQVHRNEAGFLIAGVSVDMRLVVSDDLARTGSLYAGSFADVPTINDPLLSWDGEVIRGCEPAPPPDEP